MKAELTEIIWWESCITEHQVHTLSELTNIPDVTLETYVQRFENADRKKQGWNECDLSLINAKKISSPSLRFIIKALKAKRNCIHIFAGPFDSFWITIGLFYSLFINNRTYILTEPYSPIAAELLENGGSIRNSLLKKLRPLKYQFLWILLRRKIEGIFAISPLAIKQLLLFGISKQKIFPFAYFVPSTEIFPTSKEQNKIKLLNNKLRIVFVGTLNYTKGIDLAINAIEKLNKKDVNVTLDVYGPSDELNSYLWSSYVSYKGIIPFGTAQLKISAYDLLILPSRYDGWGVVINESLLAGVPVLCSNHVGAASLVKKWRCGISYDCSNESMLMNLIVEIYQNKDRKLNEFRKAIGQMRNIIMPRSGAEYLINSVRGTQTKELALKNVWYECV